MSLCHDKSKLLNCYLKAEDEVSDGHEDALEVSLDVGNHQGQQVADTQQGTHTDQSLQVKVLFVNGIIQEHFRHSRASLSI